MVNGLIHYSPGWKSLLGYADDEIGTRIEDSYTRVHPDDLDYVKRSILEHFEQRTPTTRWSTACATRTAITSG